MGGEIQKMNKDLFHKISVVGLMILFAIAAIIPGVSSTTVKLKENENMPIERGWNDNFENYYVGQYLEDGSDSSDGGWKGWDNNFTWGAYVVNSYAYDNEKSVQIADQADIVHEFIGYNYGKWTFTAWQYIPNNFQGNSYYNLLSYYEDYAEEDNEWAVQMRFDSQNQTVESEFSNINLPLITGQWVELMTLIDLELDLFRFYYNGQLLIEKAWTAGPNNECTGILNIGAVDLYAYGASAVYYDAMSLDAGWPPLSNLLCSGKIRWQEIDPGTTVTANFIIKNDGDPGTVLNWEISEYPTDWGSNWVFMPANGTGLTPEDGNISVNVSVIAPSKTESRFTGTIKIINTDDTSDNCPIDVSIETPRNKALKYPLFLKIFQRFSNAFPTLRYFLGL